MLAGSPQVAPRPSGSLMPGCAPSSFMASAFRRVDIHPKTAYILRSKAYFVRRTVGGHGAGGKRYDEAAMGPAR
jgi:hypothetical protein